MGPDDRAFLLELYGSTRQEELSVVPWDAAQKAAFIAFQFSAQDHDYRQKFPDAAYQVICVGERSIGRLYVARRPDEIRVLDIALLPEYRGGGIGTRLLSALLAEAAASGRPVRLHVEARSAARRLYERLGFLANGETPFHTAMEWRAAAAR